MVNVFILSRYNKLVQIRLLFCVYMLMVEDVVFEFVVSAE